MTDTEHPAQPGRLAGESSDMHAGDPGTTGELPADQPAAGKAREAAPAAPPAAPPVAQPVQAAPAAGHEDWTLTVTGRGASQPEQGGLFDHIRAWADQVGYTIHGMVLHRGHQAPAPPPVTEYPPGYEPNAEAEAAGHPSAEDEGVRAATEDPGPVVIENPSAPTLAEQAVAEGHPETAPVQQTSAAVHR